jgi:Na+/citrate or Na+/malate symporter
MPRPSPFAVAAIVLGGLLVVALIFLVQAWWRIDNHMTIHGWIALTLGVVVSLAVGVGLMALVFFSARRGYDDGVGPGDNGEVS